MNLPSNPSLGDFVLDPSDGQYYMYSGSHWDKIAQYPMDIDGDGNFTYPTENMPYYVDDLTKI